MPYRTLAALILALTLLTLLACSQTAPTAAPEATPAPLATEPLTPVPTPTPEPTATPRQTRRPTVNPASVAATLRAESQRPATPVPIAITTLAPPTPVVITIPTPAPVTVTLPTIAPPPTIAIPTIVLSTLAPPPLPTIALPTITVPTIEPPPPPTLRPVVTVPSVVEVSAEIEDFAVACADIRSRDESAPEWTFEGWIAEAQAVQAPPVLADWWTAYVNMFALQDENGTNEYTQEAADDEMWAIVQMTETMQDFLMDAGCLDGYDVNLAHRTAAAWDRLVTGYGQGPDTDLREFAKACNDMKATAPTMDAVTESPWHLFYWWTQLSPPPEIQGYYDAVLAFYEEWALLGTGNIDDVSNESAMALVEAAQALDRDVLELLLRERCAG